MTVTFKERYQQEETWQNKVRVMELYHLTHVQLNSNWTLAYTASYFEVSIGLVSENLKLACALHDDEKLFEKIETREKALRKLR